MDVRRPLWLQRFPGAGRQDARGALRLRVLRPCDGRLADSHRSAALAGKRPERQRAVVSHQPCRSRCDAHGAVAGAQARPPLGVHHRRIDAGRGDGIDDGGHAPLSRPRARPAGRRGGHDDRVPEPLHPRPRLAHRVHAGRADAPHVRRSGLDDRSHARRVAGRCGGALGHLLAEQRRRPSLSRLLLAPTPARHRDAHRIPGTLSESAPPPRALSATAASGLRMGCGAGALHLVV